MRTFGDLSGFVLNKKTGNFICGHQRRAVLARLDDMPAIDWSRPYALELGLPSARFRSKERKGEIALPSGARFTVREVSWPIAFERVANVEANNPHIQGEWTDDLAALLTEIQNDTPEAMVDLLLEDLLKTMPIASPSSGLTDPDDVPDPPLKPQTKRGDLWILGDHRVLCGDSTKAEDVTRLLEDRKPFIMVTDPPYGVEYDAKWREEYDQFERHSTGKVTNDDRVDWTAAYQLFSGAIVYIWHAGVYAGDLAQHLGACQFQIRNQIIWRKQHFVFGRGAYHWQHEPCWYAVRKGAAAKWCGDRTQSTIWDIQNANPMGGKRDEEKTTHGTEKPVECMSRPIRNHGNKDDDVYDPFLGSGTTLIAAEQLERRCYGLEIEPRYVDVIVKRWQEFTGKKALRYNAEGKKGKGLQA